MHVINNWFYFVFPQSFFCHFLYQLWGPSTGDPFFNTLLVLTKPNINRNGI